VTTAPHSRGTGSASEVAQNAGYVQYVGMTDSGDIPAEGPRASAAVSQCIFCQIVEHKVAASVVFEDEQIMGFMSIQPTNPGECLVIPKAHIDHFLDLDDDTATHILIVAQRLGRNIRKVLGPPRVGYVVHGFGVPHAHFNIVPLVHSEDIVPAKIAKIWDGSIVFDGSLLPLVGREELDQVADSLRLES
jgi:histidine triad (HIT) family protein